jgi:uncharacterized membrane protein
VHQVRLLWRRLSEGFLFVPACIALCFAAFAVLLSRVDRHLAQGDHTLLFGGGPDAARSILQTIATSLITVTGLTFSVMIVTLQLVSGQFTPRALRGFLADRANQGVAGAAVGIFLYCLLVLRVVESPADGSGAFVPALSVSVAIVLGVVGLGLVLFFIHHISQMIQVSTIAARIADETRRAIEACFPLDSRPDTSAVAAHRYEQSEPTLVRAGATGFVRSIALEALAEDVGGDAELVHVAVRPGDFVTHRSPLVALWPAGCLAEERHDVLRSAFELGTEPDLAEDPLYGFRQLADIALRAVSPGVNDPTTAVTCVGYLRDLLELLAARPFPASSWSAGERGATITVERPAFPDFLLGAFGEIGLDSTGGPRVTAAVLDSLAAVAASAGATAPERLADVRGLYEAIARRAQAESGTATDTWRAPLARGGVL